MARHAPVAGASVATKVCERPRVVARNGLEEIRVGDPHARAHIGISWIDRNRQTITFHGSAT